jgi:hypothetical protein
MYMNTKPLHLNPDWLRQKYLIEGLSTYEIAAIVSRDPKCVYQKLRDFGIPTRPRGHNLAAGDCYMLHPELPNPFLGRSHSDETRSILREAASKPKPHIRGGRNGMSGRTGETNPNYKGGDCPERQRLYASGEAKEFLRTVYKRDGYVCRRCGSGKKALRGLHAHHLKDWARHPELRFDLDNVVTLCRPCHEWVHSKSNLQQDFIE